MKFVRFFLLTCEFGSVTLGALPNRTILDAIQDYTVNPDVFSDLNNAIDGLDDALDALDLARVS